MLKRYGKYPFLKTLKISDTFKLENIGYIYPVYIADIYYANSG